MRKVIMAIAVLGCVLWVSSSASAQRLEAYGGYSFSHNNSTDSVTSNANGGRADVGIFPFGGFGIIADLGGDSIGSFTRTQNGVATNYKAPVHDFHYLFGIRQRINVFRLSIYFQTLAGGVTRSAIVDSNLGDAGKSGVNGQFPTPSRRRKPLGPLSPRSAWISGLITFSAFVWDK
jgi:hypothetical protein